MKPTINHRHLSLIISLFLLYLAISYWNVVAKFLQTIFSATVPLLIGGIIAYIVNLIMRRYEQLYSRLFKRPGAQKFKRLFSLVLAYLSIILLVTIVAALVIPELIACIKLLIANHSHIINHFFNSFTSNRDLQAMLNNFDPDKIKWDQVGKYLTTGLGGTFKTVVSTASSVFSTAATIVIAFFFSVYLLIYKEMLQGQFMKLIKLYLPKYQARLMRILQVFNESYSNYIVGQCKDAALLGLSCFIGMSILRLPYASMIGVVTAFGALIPIIGAILGASVGIIILFAVSPVQAGIFLIFIVVLQQLDNRITYPLVVGKSIGLPSVWVFVAVIVGGGISGIIGMMFTVPFFAAIYKLLKADAHQRTDSSE